MEHLNLFSEKPVRIDNDDMWLSFVWHPENVHTCERMQIDPIYFPNLTWEDESIEVMIVPICNEHEILQPCRGGWN